MVFPEGRKADTYPASVVIASQKEVEMGDIWLALHWGSPIGIGIFLLCLGGMVCLFAKADEISKRTRAKVKELEQKGIDISRGSKS